MAWHSVWTTSYWALGNYDSQNVADNATMVYNKLTGAGWTHNAACAVIGNLIKESAGINPGQFQQGYNYSWSAGFGIAQWTPGTKVSTYIGSQVQGVVDDGDRQMDLLMSDSSQYGTQFLNPDGSSNYYSLTGLPYITTMAAFSQSNASLDDLTALWCICWERPNNQYAYISERQSYARYYDTMFSSPGSGQHRIYVSSTGNGECWADKTMAIRNEYVYLTALPYGTDTFINWDVLAGNVVILPDNSFRMTNKTVRIVGNFTGSSPDPSPPTIIPIWWLWKFYDLKRRIHKWL